MLGFGELCHYKVSRQKSERALEGKLGSKWRLGMFLEYSRDSNEHLVWDIADQDLVRARSLQRKPKAQRWSAEELMKVDLRPKDPLYRATAEPTGRREPSQGFEERPDLAHPQVATRTRSIHDFSVLKKHLEEFGYTEVGCPRSVSYTHLRAHETREDLVCRLLLEKKKI